METVLGRMRKLDQKEKTTSYLFLHDGVRRPRIPYSRLKGPSHDDVKPPGHRRARPGETYLQGETSVEGQRPITMSNFCQAATAIYTASRGCDTWFLLRRRPQFLQTTSFGFPWPLGGSGHLQYQTFPYVRIPSPENKRYMRGKG